MRYRYTQGHGQVHHLWPQGTSSFPGKILPFSVFATMHKRLGSTTSICWSSAIKVWAWNPPFYPGLIMGGLEKVMGMRWGVQNKGFNTFDHIFPPFFLILVLLIHNLILVSNIQHSSSAAPHNIKSSPRPGRSITFHSHESPGPHRNRAIIQQGLLIQGSLYIAFTFDATRLFIQIRENRSNHLWEQS